jgi:hypothetical protein
MGKDSAGWLDKRRLHIPGIAKDSLRGFRGAQKIKTQTFLRNFRDKKPLPLQKQKTLMLILLQSAQFSGVARRAHKFAECRNIGAVSANSGRIDWQT